MSRSNEIPKSEGMALDNTPVAGERQHEPTRGGISREAAHREMDRFLGPHEYSVRKLIGQRTVRQNQTDISANKNPEVAR